MSVSALLSGRLSSRCWRGEKVYPPGFSLSVSQDLKQQSLCRGSLVNSITGVTFEITSEVCVTTCSISSYILHFSITVTSEWDDVWLQISSKVLLLFFIFLLPLQWLLYPVHFVPHTSIANETKWNLNQTKILPCPWALVSESCRIL